MDNWCVYDVMIPFHEVNMVLMAALESEEVLLDVVWLSFIDWVPAAAATIGCGATTAAAAVAALVSADADVFDEEL